VYEVLRKLGSFSLQIKLLLRGSGLICFKKLSVVICSLPFIVPNVAHLTLGQMLTWEHCIAEFHRRAIEVSSFCLWKTMISEIANVSLSC